MARTLATAACVWTLWALPVVAQQPTPSGSSLASGSGSPSDGGASVSLGAPAGASPRSASDVGAWLEARADGARFERQLSGWALVGVGAALGAAGTIDLLVGDSSASRAARNLGWFALVTAPFALAAGIATVAFESTQEQRWARWRARTADGASADERRALLSELESEASSSRTGRRRAAFMLFGVALGGFLVGTLAWSTHLLADRQDRTFAAVVGYTCDVSMTVVAVLSLVTPSSAERDLEAFADRFVGARAGAPSSTLRISPWVGPHGGGLGVVGSF